MSSGLHDLKLWFFADRFRVRDPERAALASRFSSLTLIIALAWLVVALVHATQFRRLALLHATVGILTLLLRWWGLRRGDASRSYLGSHLNVGLSTVGLTVLALVTGQHHAMALWFFAAMPLLAAYQLGFRECVFWTTVCLGLAVSVTLSGQLFEVPPEFVPVIRERAFNHLLLILIVAGLALAARRTMDRNLSQIKQQTDVARRQAGDLLIARDEALEASRAKSDFLANMSHELRTPLNSIIGFANLLHRDRHGLDERGLEFLERIRRNGAHLLELISDVLDMSRIEAGKLTLEIVDVDLAALVDETVGQLEGLAQEKQIEIRRGIPEGIEPVRADRFRLRQVLINLLSNAIKFTDEGSVTVRVLTETGSQVPFSMEIEDTGVGIPVEAQERIFESFAQADTSMARHYEGTGLGLPISKSLLELMGFRIGVESEPGRGSIFRVYFTPVVPGAPR